MITKKDHETLWGRGKWLSVSQCGLKYRYSVSDIQDFMSEPDQKGYMVARFQYYSFNITGSRMLRNIMNWFYCRPLFTSCYFALFVSICFTVQVKSLYLLVIVISRHNFKKCSIIVAFYVIPQSRSQFGFLRHASSLSTQSHRLPRRRS